MLGLGGTDTFSGSVGVDDSTVGEVGEVHALDSDVDEVGDDGK